MCLGSSPNSKHACLGADVAQVGTVEAFAQLDDSLIVDLARLTNRLGVDLEDLHACSLVG